jgi:hypothetical protein
VDRSPSGPRPVEQAHGILSSKMKDRRRRLDGGEWESIKIPHRNLTYIPNRTICPSLLTRSRPHRYSKAVSPRNRVSNCSRNIKTVLVRTRVRSTIKIRSKNNLYPYRHFTEHLVGTLRKSPWENTLNHKSSSRLGQ